MWDTKVFTLYISVNIFWTSTDVVQGRFVYHSEINRWVQQDKVVATWEQAKLHCESEGAFLASPINEDLANYMTSLIDVDNHQSPYFIGMKLIPNSDIFKSIEGTVLDDLPEAIINKIDKLDPREGECLGMSRSNIHVVPCWARLPYLCYTNRNSTVFEPTTMPPPPPRPVQQSTPNWYSWTTYRTTTEPSIEVSTSNPAQEATDCDYGYQFYSGSCYKVHHEYVTWYVAESTCTDEGAYLAVINDENEAEYLKNKTSQDNDYDDFAYKWIGIRKIYGNWISVHGDSLDDIFNIWSNTKSGSHCGALKNDGLLDDLICNAKQSFICEKSAQPTYSTLAYKPRQNFNSTRSPTPTTMKNAYTTLCGAGYQFYSGSCYKVHHEYKTWYVAESTCTDEGAYLAVINDEYEAEYLTDIAFRDNDMDLPKWIGLRHINGSWSSVRGDRIDEIFNSWAYVGFVSKCGVLNSNRRLDDYPCHSEYHFICEKSIQGASTTTTTALPPTKMETYTTTYRPPRCSYGYEFHSGICYKVHDEYKTWDEAKSTCSDEGANLAVINDANEAQVLQSITSRPDDKYIRKWIGIQQIDGFWRSIHGVSLRQLYHAWADSAYGLPCGALTDDGLLDDQSCDFEYRFICEKYPNFD